MSPFQLPAQMAYILVKLPDIIKILQCHVIYHTLQVVQHHAPCAFQVVNIVYTDAWVWQ